MFILLLSLSYSCLMDKIKMIFYIGVFMFIMVVVNYQQPTHLQSQVFCQKDKDICLLCPTLPPFLYNYGLSYRLLIKHDHHFKVTQAFNNYSFDTRSCHNLHYAANDITLSILEHSEAHNLFKEGNIEQRDSQLMSFHGINFHFSTLNAFNNFIIAYNRNADGKQPIIYVQNTHNFNKILSFSTILACSVLLSILLYQVLIKLSLVQIKKQEESPYILLSLLSLAYQMYISCDYRFFQSLIMVEIAFIAILALTQASQISKHLIVVGMVVIYVYNPSILIFEGAILYWLWKQKRQREDRYANKIRMVVMMLLVRMLLRMCYLAIPLSFAAFVSHLWNSIFIPLTYLLYRIQDGIVAS